ncbi:type III-B CRISPR module RAMP protein Cmr4 [Nocardiopsis alba]|uniref:type III-B CRISPR module RAMP protein Cmr4 n=1 Tax=Nocardiopsis alba TaxID=53437 RepID=UPI0033DCC247
MTSYLLYLYAESPLHAGAAGAEGSLDLPIQRESTTGYPVVWGQSLKGALRSAGRDAGWEQDSLDRIFGKTVKREGEPGVNPSAGLLTVGDAQLVALPVPTLRRTFAWATSEVALGRLARKYTRLDPRSDRLGVPDVGDAQGWALDEEWVSDGQVLGSSLVPMSLPPKAEKSEWVKGWADRIAADGIGEESALAPFAKKFRSDLLVVGTTVMGQLLRECTEHSVRVQLDPETKTVENGPFTSEYLPTETLLATVLTLRASQDVEHDAEHRRLLNELFDGAVLQIGGDETLGKGLVWSRLVAGGSGE